MPMKSGFPNPASTVLDWSRGILIRGNITGPEIILFVRNRLGNQTLEGCRPIRTNMFELSFREKVLADRFAALGNTFDMNGKMVEQRRAGKIVKIVYVHGLPFPFPDHVLTHYMSSFGEVQGISREKWSDLDEETGVRIVKLVVENDPPNFLQMGDFTARLSYAGLTRVCRKCGAAGHWAESCDVQRCFNCGETGHFAARCQKPCHLCQSTEHCFLSCSRKTFAQVLAGARAGAQTPLPTVTMDQQPEEHVAEHPVVNDEVEEVAAATVESSSEPSPAEPDIEDPVPLSDSDNFQKKFDAYMKSKRSSELETGLVVSPDAKSQEQEPPTKRSRPKELVQQVKVTHEVDTMVVIPLPDGKKVTVDLSAVFKNFAALGISDRKKRTPFMQSAGYWKTDRRRLYLRASEIEILEDYINRLE